MERRKSSRPSTARPLGSSPTPCLTIPGWRAVGPDRTGHRRRVALRYHRAAIGVVHRYGRPIYGAYRDGALAGVAVTFARRPLSPAGLDLRASTSRLPARRARRRSCAACAPQASRTAATRTTSTSSSGSSPSTRRHQRARRRPGPARARLRGGRGARLSRHGQPGQRPLLRELRLRGDRSRPPAEGRDHVAHAPAYEASLRRWASGSPSSFFSVLFSIWRMRSRVTPKARPTSSSVRALLPRSP